MPAVSPTMRSAVLAVLQEAKQAGVRGISKTSLTKLVYLLDCLYAEGHGGQTLSGAHWYLHHYGPFATDLASAIDELGVQGVIQSKAGESKNKEFALFWLGEYPVGPRATDLGLSGSLASRFAGYISKYANDLSKLLDYVYFKTTPMRDASPGDQLDFHGLAIEGEQTPHRHTHIKDPAKIMRLLELSEAMRKKFEVGRASARAMAAHRPIYDGAFSRAMAEADAEDVTGNGHIPFDARLI